MTQLGLKVMLVDDRRETKRLHFRHMLFFLRFLGLLLLLETIFSIVEHLAYRRLRLRRDTQQIKPLIESDIQSLTTHFNSQLFAIRIDDQHFLKTDLLVYQVVVHIVRNNFSVNKRHLHFLIAERKVGTYDPLHSTSDIMNMLHGIDPHPLDIG